MILRVLVLPYALTALFYSRNVVTYVLPPFDEITMRVLFCARYNLVAQARIRHGMPPHFSERTKIPFVFSILYGFIPHGGSA